MEPNPSAKAVHIVGRYAVYDAIAAGGMATVHYGRLLGPVGFSRTVAIKRLHAQFARDPEFVSMFLDEARLAARIRHPNVVPTLDVVAMEGELFLVMEYVPGESLARLLRTASRLGTNVPPRIVIAIMSGVLRGLHAAHEATNERSEPLGIVHRDVSPQNVLVGTDGQARVLDFGVAKAAGRLQTTRDGQLKGKLAYMAPEQLRGKVIDRRTDIFAASTVLWEALTGRRLFRGDNEGAIITKILEGAVEAPSTAVPREKTDHAARVILAAADAIVLKGLATQPEDRYETARAMAVALEKVAPMAGVAEVSEWVELFAKDVLVTRAQQVAEIESVSAVGPASVAALRDGVQKGLDSVIPPALDSRPRLTPDGERDGRRSMPVDLSTISVASQAQRSAGMARRSRSLLWVVFGVVFCVTGFTGFAIVRSTGMANVAATTKTPSTVPSVVGTRPVVAPIIPLVTATGATVASGAPTSVVLPTAPLSASATVAPSASTLAPEVLPLTKASSTTGVTSPTVSHRVVHPAAPSAQTGSTPAPSNTTPGCNPPFTYDAQGLKHFKPECL